MDKIGKQVSALAVLEVELADVRTPTLVLHSRDDRRCPLPMGQMLHQALRAGKVHRPESPLLVEEVPEVA